MKQKGNVSSSEFYMSRKGDKVKELIMILDGAATLKFVYLEGEMTLKDIQNIMMYQGTTGWNGGTPDFQLNTLDLADINILTKDRLKDLKGLKNIAKLNDIESLQEQMDSDTWTRFEEQMEELEERLENLK